METLLRQRIRGLRSVSFQLPCEEDVLPSAFKDKPLRAAGRAGAQTADHWVRRYVRGGSAQKLDCLIMEITQLEMALWADLPAWG